MQCPKDAPHTCLKVDVVLINGEVTDLFTNYTLGFAYCA